MLSQFDVQTDENREIPLIDKAPLEQFRRDLGEDMLLVLITSYCKEVEDRCATVRELADSSDYWGLERQFHALKGTSASYGAKAIEDKANRLERFLKESCQEEVRAELEDFFSTADTTVRTLRDQYLQS